MITSDEWNFFIAGSARIGIYAAQGNARTYDYVSSPFTPAEGKGADDILQHAGDTGYIPKAMTHYVENVGKDDVIFIEVLQADHFSGMFTSSL